MWLDVIVRDRFEGGRWSLPARVYARPIELYAGLAISPGNLVRILRASGYREDARADAPGLFRSDGPALEIFTRQFDYWDGSEPARRLRLSIRDAQIDKLVDSATGNGLEIARIDPPLIAKIYPEHDEDRVLVPYAEVPQALIEALMATEDRHFYTHRGVDLRGILRALWVNLRKLRIAQGGSTLTQQLVKNYFLADERTFFRKFNEIIMALLLERRYSKSQILGAYMNEVYLGQYGARSVHGFGTAAEFYFARPLVELRLDQIALLAGLVRGASFYNPRQHPERALARRNLVIRLMAEQDYISERESAAAQVRALDLSPYPSWAQSRYPAFEDLVRRQLSQDYRPEDLRSEGLRIFTSLDVSLQDTLASVAQAQVAALERERGLKGGTLETAAVLVDINNGEVLAIVGGRNSRGGEFNRSLDARRPIGSLIKPFVYVAALSEPSRYNLLTRLDDSPLRIRQPAGGSWSPRNYDGEDHGAVSLLEALVFSYNVSTVRLGMDVGLDKVVRTLRDSGLEAHLDAYPSLLLGALELSPLEVAQLYQTLGNGGFRAPLNSIREVLDRNGAGLTRYGLTLREALDPGATFLTAFALTRVTTEGTGRDLVRWLAGVQPVAGKTGTTDELRDSWFAGYGSNLMAVVWLGRDDNRPMGLSGAAGAMRIWAAMMKAAGLRALVLRPPADVHWSASVAVPYAGQCTLFDAIPFLSAVFQPGATCSAMAAARRGPDSP